MARNISVDINPFDTVADSAVTSKNVPLWDADRLTLSLQTAYASGSTLTIQLSNAPYVVPESVAEATWSDWTVVGQSAVALSSGITVLDDDVPVGFKYMRALRSSDTTTGTLRLVKHIR